MNQTIIKSQELKNAQLKTIALYKNVEEKIIELGCAIKEAAIMQNKLYESELWFITKVATGSEILCKIADNLGNKILKQEGFNK
jgi:hypothetical protein